MNNRTKILALAVLLCLPLGLLATIPIHYNEDVNKEPATFVISSWDYPDEYGQGIYAMRIYENSTGSWVNVGGWIEYYEDTLFDWNASVAIKIRCESAINATLTGASSSADGINYQRHNVTVTNINGTVVFSQQNFTYIDDVDYAYAYEVVLDFIPLAGQIYTATITYEVFY